MEPRQAVLIILFVLLLVIYFLRNRKKVNVQLPDNYDKVLKEHVVYYKNLSPANQQRFTDKVKEFLSYVRIHGVNTEITELDKLFVAASAVIPIFGFDNWKYNNITDVLIYPASFSQDRFSLSEGDVNTLGMVGNGPMQRVMILSLPALRAGFEHERDKNNTGIHEFVHLLDKEDGSIDGLPEALLQRQYTVPWLRYMSEEIEKIKHHHSDIDVYGATNRAEFLAVAAEYFFQQPELFKEKHPDLFEMMEKIFNQDIVQIEEGRGEEK